MEKRLIFSAAQKVDFKPVEVPDLPGAGHVKLRSLMSAIRRLLGGKSPDVVIECSGNNKGLRGAVQAAGIGGTVVAAGFYAQPATDFCFGEEFLHNRITLKASMGVWGCPARWPLTWDRHRNLVTVLALIESGRLNVAGYVDLKVPFAEAQRAYDTIRDSPSYLRVALTY